VSADETHPLGSLRWHWGSAYAISYRMGRWIASRRDDGGRLEAEEAEELRELIRDDYEARPVPRPSIEPARPTSIPRLRVIEGG
jgi:hypothetical protein